jgi:superfamily II DNA or RNA helicase
MEELLAAIRSTCSPKLWSQGVELARRLAVTGISDDDAEIVCRVKVPQRAIPFTVRLYPEDAEWDCDCDARTACCEHVASAAIAVNKARAAGQELPEGRSQGATIVNCFSRHRGHLSLERVIRWDGDKQRPLKGTLGSAVATQSEGMELSPSQQDLALDRLLGTRLGGGLHAELGVQAVKLLGGARNVEVDGVSMYVSTETLRPSAVLTERGAKGETTFVLTLTRDPRLEEVLAPGVGRIGTTLHLLEATSSAGNSWEQLPSEKVYEGSEIAALVTEVLPEVAKHFSLTVNAPSLPPVDRSLRPREVLYVEQAGEVLSVRPEVVYGDPITCRIDNGRLVYVSGALPVRNESAELKVAERVKARLGLNVGRRITVSGTQATELAVRLDRFDGEVVGRRRDSFIRAEVLQPELGTDHTGVPQLRFRTRAPDGSTLSASAEAVMQAWTHGQPLVPLLDGGWAPLPAGWMAQYGTLLERVFALRDEDGHPQASAKPALVELYAALNTPAPPDLEPLRMLLMEPSALAAPSLPKDLTATLRPYQLEGVRWLSILGRARIGGTLADDMGLGKTLQVICNLEGRCLVVAPTSLVFNWADEIAKFRPQLAVNIYHGKGRALTEGPGVTLTSYALLRLDLDLLRAQSWDMVVLDEAQAIKNPESQVAQAAYALRGKFRITVTGTPVENRLEELWSQFHFTNPGLLGGREAFKRRYVDTVTTPEQLASLRRLITPFILRRDKKSVAKDLPARSDLVLRCDLDDQERALYDGLLHSTRKEVVEQLAQGGSVMKALEALLRLRQAACHRALVPGQAAHSSTKVERLCTELEECIADGHRALVFSQWTGFLDLVEPHLKERGISFGRLDGSTRDRASVVNTFQNDESGPAVLLLSLKAGGVGLNLTAADHVFLLDLWWNPAVEQQAADRAHRIGQQNPVFVHRIVARNTVEEKILLLQASKRAVAEAVLSGADEVAGLTREDLLTLLSP